MEVLIAMSFRPATHPVAKLGGRSSQRLICARFMTSCERMECADDVLGDALSQKELLS